MHMIRKGRLKKLNVPFLSYRYNYIDIFIERSYPNEEKSRN